MVHLSYPVIHAVNGKCFDMLTVIIVEMAHVASIKFVQKAYVIVNVLMSFCTKGLRQGNLEEGFLFWGL
jgi:hypothetical protein